MMTVNRLLNLPWRLSKEQLAWLRNRTKDRRPEGAGAGAAYI